MFTLAIVLAAIVVYRYAAGEVIHPAHFWGEELQVAGLSVAAPMPAVLSSRQVWQRQGSCRDVAGLRATVGY